MKKYESEAEIEAKLRDAAKAAGGKAFKFVSPGNAGVPDRIVVLPGGKTGFVELKQAGKKTTKLQKVQIRKLLDLGFYATVLDSPDLIPGVLENIKRTPLSAEELKKVQDHLRSQGQII